MWQKLPIRNQMYFMSCSTNINSTITCILYGLDECWSETVSLNEMQDKIKLLNRRLQFSEYVKNTLLNGNVESAALEELSPVNADYSNTSILKLKYRIEGCLLKYEWRVIKQSCKEFQQNFIAPLLVTINYIEQQVEALQEILGKKDDQLQQFYREGFRLNRKTLNTKKFNFDEFKKGFPMSRNAQDLKDLAKMVVEANTCCNSGETSIKDNVFVNQNHQSRRTPKKRKRMIVETKINMKKNILCKNEKPQYESQSSQTTIETNSQSDGVLVHYVCAKDKQTFEDKTVNSNKLTNVDVKDEIFNKCIKPQNTDKIESNDINDTNYIEENVLNKSSLDETVPDIQRISDQLQIVKQELKELEKLRVANLAKRKNRSL